MKYRYSLSEQLDTAGRPTRRPIVELQVERENHRRKFYALIDSGADQILMPSSIADVFGIDRAACPVRPVIGVSMEPVEGFVAELRLHIQNQPKPFSAPVVFMDSDVPVLLGREAFFDRYRIAFEQTHGTFEILAAQ